MLFRKRERDDIRPLTGWKRFLYHFGRFVLFPLRRPVITLIVLFLMFLIPTFRGVKPVNVHRWYASQISQMQNKILVWWGTRQPEVLPGEFKFNPDEPAPAPVVPSEFKVPKEDDVPNILDVLKGTTSSEKTQDKPVTEEETDKEDEKSTSDSKQEDVKDVVKKISKDSDDEIIKNKKYLIPQDDSIYEYPTDKKVSSLDYLDFPYEIKGKAVVHDGNEIEVNGEFIMMYGIYIHPYTVQGGQATNYLKNLIDGKEVTCGIVAYTTQRIATGICYYGEENINKTMVLKGLTKNVAL